MIHRELSLLPMLPMLPFLASPLLACSSSSSLLPDGGAVEVDVQQEKPDARRDQLAPDRGPSPPSWGRCDEAGWFEGYHPPSAAVQCATLKVPLDASQPGGPTFDLRVAREKATSPVGAPRAIVHIAGGPGVSSIALSASLLHYLPGLTADFDHLYVDLRGTGFSDALVCPGGAPSTKAEWEGCASGQGDRDLNHYLTLDGANDLEHVRQRLGYDKLILDGGSYGTRVVLEYMRQHPERLASAVLTSLAPPDWTYFSWMVKTVDQSVAGLVARCNKDAACTALVPDLAADLAARRQALKDSPRMVKVNGVPMAEDLEAFGVILGAALDNPSTYFKTPRAIHAAVAGDNSLWNAIIGNVLGASVKDASNLPKRRAPVQRLRPARRWMSLGPDLLADALHAAVVCAEWLPNEAGIADLQKLASQQTWGSPSDTALAEACAAWKVNPVPASLRAPVTSSAKALLITGELDLRTPVSLGEHTAATLKNATHLVVPYAGHADEMATNTCVNQIMTDFIKADGDIKAVDTSCLGKRTQPSW